MVEKYSQRIYVKPWALDFLFRFGNRTVRDEQNLIFITLILITFKFNKTLKMKIKLNQASENLER
jgi:hypothetical protein